MSLEPLVHREGARRGVHAAEVLRGSDVLVTGPKEEVGEHRCAMTACVAVSLFWGG